MIGDGGLASRVPVKNRVQVPFRGSISVAVPDSTDSVIISFGRQPSQSFDPSQPIVWRVPGSGAYYFFLTLQSHDEFAWTRTTYALPLYAPRS